MNAIKQINWNNFTRKRDLQSSNFRIIEEVIYKSCPTPLGAKRKTGPLPLGKEISDKDRIEKIINDLFEFGVSFEFFFEVDDLLKNKNMKKVTEFIGFNLS